MGTDTIFKGTVKSYPVSRLLDCIPILRNRCLFGGGGVGLSKEEGSLSPYRVLDLSDSKRAYCTKLFADLGADVIKVEAPQGDPGRKIAPFAGDMPHPKRSHYFLHRNAGKRGITLDLDIETLDGRNTLIGFVGRADILVENPPPDYMASLSLDCGDEDTRQRRACERLTKW